MCLMMKFSVSRFWKHGLRGQFLDLPRSTRRACVARLVRFAFCGTLTLEGLDRDTSLLVRVRGEVLAVLGRGGRVALNRINSVKSSVPFAP